MAASEKLLKQNQHTPRKQEGLDADQRSHARRNFGPIEVDPDQGAPHELGKTRCARIATQAQQGASIMNVGKLCNPAVVVVHRDTSLHAAAKLMRAHHVGSLVVVEENDRGQVPVGILTDRDIVIEVVAMGLDSHAATAGEIISPQLIAVQEGDTVLEVLKVMRRHGVRRTPVLTAAGSLAGIITLDDIMEIIAEGFEDMSKTIADEQSTEVRLRKSFSPL